MQNGNWKLESIWSGVGWGLFLILIGTLFVGQNTGWLNGNGWLYFAIGLGSILVIGVLVRYFIGHNRIWSMFGGLAAGLALIYIGMAFLYGFGDWWPLALIIIGLGYLVKALWRNRAESSSN